MPLDLDRDHRRGGQRATLALAALLAFATGIADAADTPSAGVLLRRARHAIADGRRAEAAEGLRAVRAAEPGSHRGLEAAVLLADLQLKGGDAAGADRTLADAGQHFRDGEPAAQLLLARGWLAIARGDASGAIAHFAVVAARTDVRTARELAALGTGWARLTATPPSPDLPAELVSLAASAQDPMLRIGALLALIRGHAARGEQRAALRSLRTLRRLARNTSFADDVELGIGLAQLDLGRPAAARRTLARLAAEAAPPEARLAPEDAGLTLADLRLPPAAFTARLAALYAAQSRPGLDLRHFLGTTLDRPAHKDATAALALAEAALAARKDS